MKYAGKAAGSVVGGSGLPRILGGGSRAATPGPGRSSGGGGSPAAGRPSASSSQGGHRADGGGSNERGGGGGERPGNRSDDNDSDGSACSTTGETHSFAPATLVLLADGTAKPIAEVAIGDQVIATDPQTGALETETVEQLHRNDDTDLTDLTISVDRGGIDETSVVKTTWHHPFWNESTDSWTDAQDLRPGNRLRTSDGAIALVVEIHNYVSAAEMRDLTIADAHTYYVVVGEASVLVHNCGGSNPTHADRCLCGTGGPVRLAIVPREVSSFGDLAFRGRVGDGLTPDHTPQVASRRLPHRNDYAAVALTDPEHALTRDWRWRGRETRRDDAQLSFRTVVALKMWNYRMIGQRLYGDPTYFNESIKGVLAYYRTNFPHLGV
ncbi:HINT domain-containing protein [Dactylosporangium sp. NBC_01737]|uniref:polymorphic toxin-type HINT domain-containing protein n=1 Tax=Dactylosporangium sp. NBC_01737 TaxID=2975959 RepID=UPI002E12DCF0|nr:HINT domain-containing protein [Dactylosporangium sp. NBC_01737]